MYNRDIDFCLDLVIYLKDGTPIYYTRYLRPEYSMEDFAIYESEVKQISTLKELIKTLEKQELLHLVAYECIDIDEFCEYLIEKNGKEFIPDENVEWYSTSDGSGMSGAEVVEYWKCYQDNKEAKEKFLEKIKNLREDVVEKVVFMKTYEYYGRDSAMDDDEYKDYEDKIYTVNLRRE